MEKQETGDVMRKKLTDILEKAGKMREFSGSLARILIENGVTINEWIPVEERMPKNFISVLGYMTDAGDFPPVRECYTVGDAFYFPALGDAHPVSHWMELPEPPKEVE